MIKGLAKELQRIKLFNTMLNKIKQFHCYEGKIMY